MAVPNYGTAAQQMALMLQTIDNDIKVTENLEQCCDRMFSTIGPDQLTSLEKHRAPIQIEVGGVGGGYQPDGGSYFQGTGPQYDQMIIQPVPILVVTSATELSRRLSEGGSNIVIQPYISRLIANVKTKAAHLRNAYLQGYNNGVLAVVDASYGGGATVPLKNLSFGGRLLDRGGIYQVTDAALNVIDTVSVLDLSKNAVGGIDTVTLDHVPAGLAAGYQFIPIGLASGAPIWIQGLQYLITPSALLEYCGIQRANSYVQAPAYNANGAFLTLGIVETFMARMEQALGNERFTERKRNKWYGHQAQRVSANILGFGKTFYMQSDGKTPSYDIAASPFSKFTIGGIEVDIDSMAAVDKLYYLDPSTLKRVRYPGSQQFIKFGANDIFWPRQVGGQWNTESDAMYQDSVNYYVNLPWANGVVYGLGLQPSLSN